jgi:glutamine synthetase
MFLDYANNRIYRLSDAKQREIEQLPTSTGDAHVTYFIDSTFYSWLTSKNLVD